MCIRDRLPSLRGYARRVSSAHDLPNYSSVPSPNPRQALLLLCPRTWRSHSILGIRTFFEGSATADGRSGPKTCPSTPHVLETTGLRDQRNVGDFPSPKLAHPPSLSTHRLLTPLFRYRLSAISPRAKSANCLINFTGFQISSACCLHLSLISLSCSGFAKAEAKVSASDSGDRLAARNPVLLGTTISGIPPTANASTGVPQASDSWIVQGAFSILAG